MAARHERDERLGATVSSRSEMDPSRRFRRWLRQPLPDCSSHNPRVWRCAERKHDSGLWSEGLLAAGLCVRCGCPWASTVIRRDWGPARRSFAEAFESTCRRAAAGQWGGCSLQSLLGTEAATFHGHHSLVGRGRSCGAARDRVNERGLVFGFARSGRDFMNSDCRLRRRSWPWVHNYQPRQRSCRCVKYRRKRW